MRSTDGGVTWSGVFSQTAFGGFATTVFDVQYKPVNPNHVLPAEKSGGRPTRAILDVREQPGAYPGRDAINAVGI
jgi:hypothetical protein